MGEPNEVRPGRGEFHENPSSCICEDSEGKAKVDPGSQSQTKTSHKNEKGNDESKIFGEPTGYQFSDDEPDWSDPDYGESQSGPEKKGQFNGTDLDNELFLKSEEPELEEMLSD